MARPGWPAAPVFVVNLPADGDGDFVAPEADAGDDLVLPLLRADGDGGGGGPVAVGEAFVPVPEPVLPDFGGAGHQ